MDLRHWSTFLEDLNLQGLFYLSIGVAVLWFVTFTAINWYRLSHIPGPFLASVTNLWAFRSVRRLQMHRTVQEVQERYGKIVRIAPNAIMVSDPETIWSINSARSSYSRSGWYSCIRFNPYDDSVFSELDSVKHDKRKAKLSFGFSGKGLMDLEGSLDAQLAILVNTLKGRIASSGQGQAVVDLGRTLQYFQVDLITFAGTGKAWGDLPSDKDHFDYLAAGDRHIPFVHSIAMVPFIRHLFFSPLFLRWFGPNTSEGWLGVLHAAVEQRVKGGKTEDHGGDMLGEWLKHGLSPAESELDLSIQVPAGTETSISTIRGIMLLLMTSPGIYSKLKTEITSRIQDGRISTPIANEEAKNFPYLQAVIYEGLRMMPPVTAAFPKRVPHGGDVICGKSVPEGTEVHVNFISLMQDQHIFGSDTDIFRPERFIECDDATRTKRSKVVELNFGHGRWLCLGKMLALMEMNKIFVELLRSFDFQLYNPEKPWCRKSTSTLFISDFYARVTESSVN